jgi:hypothetical protein
LDGDGTPDIVLPCLFYSGAFKGNGDGTFPGAAPIWLVPVAGAFKFVDLNGDGHPDILVSSGSVGLHVVLSSGRKVPLINQGGVVNRGSFASGQPIGPGGFVSLFGTNLSSQTVAAAAILLPTTLNQVSVTINGEAAPLYFVSSGQSSVQAPWDLNTSGTASVVVTNNGASRPTVQVATAVDSPAVLNDGAGHAIAINLDGKVAAASGAVPGLTTHPAKRGQAIIFYATGLGTVSGL